MRSNQTKQSNEWKINWIFLSISTKCALLCFNPSNSGIVVANENIIKGNYIEAVAKMRHSLHLFHHSIVLNCCVRHAQQKRMSRCVFFSDISIKLCWIQLSRCENCRAENVIIRLNLPSNGNVWSNLHPCNKIARESEWIPFVWHPTDLKLKTQRTIARHQSRLD